jgi:flagellin
MPVINTNTGSLYGLMNLNKTENLLNEASQRLSSGKKLNNATDDAAGMSIQTRMTSQVMSLNMAVKNANDGMSMINSVEGSLDELTNMLQRMRELAVQSANDTNNGTDRGFIQDEINQLQSEITSVSNRSQFNGSNTLDGSFVNKRLQVGPNSGQYVTFSVDSVNAAKLGAYVKTGTTKEAAAAAATPTANTNTTAEDVTINGKGASTAIAAAANNTAKTIAAGVNAVSGNTGVTAKAQTFAKFLSTAADATYSVKINGTSTGNFTIGSASVGDAVKVINQVSGSTGVTASASADGTFVTLYDATGEDITVENESAGTDLDVVAVGYNGTTAGSTIISLAATAGNDATRVQGNIELSSAKSFSVTQAGTAALGYFVSGSSTLNALTGVDVKSQSTASNAIATIDGALEKVSSMRAELGALSNRLGYTVSNQTNIATKTEEALSRIVDADFAQETAKLTKAQILQQAGTAMLAQANQSKQTVLALLA